MLIALIAMACSRPVAMFVLEDELTAPVRLSAKNMSASAKSYSWYLDGILISESFESPIDLENSGRYLLELRAYDGVKEDIYSKQIVVDAPESCVVLMKTTLGNMAFTLSELTPRHQSNFIDLIESGYYEDVVFHRVIKGFMIQAGEKEGDTRSFQAEIEHEITDELVHVKGALAAARMPDDVNPEMNSSPTQFYIVQGRDIDESDLLNYSSENLVDYSEDQKKEYLERGGAPQLDMKYTVFGKMIYGESVLDAIASLATDNRDKPLEDVRILEIKLIN